MLANQRAPVKTQGIFRTNRNAAPAICTFARSHHSGLGGLLEIENLRFWADLGAFTAMRTGGGIKAYPQRRHFCNQGIERPEWA